MKDYQSLVALAGMVRLYYTKSELEGDVNETERLLALFPSGTPAHRLVMAAVQGEKAIDFIDLVTIDEKKFNVVLKEHGY